MKNKEFNLSEKIEIGNSARRQIPCFDYIATRDVKEFIRLLKEILKKNSDCYYYDNWKALDKLAGEGLI